VEDKSGSTELLCFAEPYERGRHALASGEVLLFAGRTSRREGEDTRIVLEQVLPLEEACERLVAEIQVDLRPDLGPAETDRLLALVGAHPGSRPLRLRVADGDFQTEVVARRAAVRPCAAFLGGLVELFGEERVTPRVAALESLLPREEGRPRRWKRAQGAAG